MSAAELLKNGDLVGMPTETVYGLAACCFNEAAVAKIFTMKGRPARDPLIVHISSLTQLGSVAEVSAQHKIILDRLKNFWPGPLTLILPKKNTVPDIVTAGLKTVAVRMPNHPIALKLIEFSGPLAAPSANISTKVSPTTAEHVQDEFGEKLKIILDGGSSDIGLESTILDISNVNKPRILRPGGVTLEEISKIIPEVAEESYFKNSSDIQESPGQMIEHYCPNTPIVYLNSYQRSEAKNIGLITLSDYPDLNLKVKVHKKLSQNASLSEAAHNLFACMRELDKMSLDVILIEALPRQGIGRAIMDRLDRATARFKGKL